MSLYRGIAFPLVLMSLTKTLAEHSGLYLLRWSQCWGSYHRFLWLPSQAQVANHRWWSKIWPVTNQVSPSEQIPPRIKNSRCVTPNLRMLINNSKVNIRLAPFRRHRVWVSSDYSLSHRDASHQLRRSSLWTTTGATVDRPGCMHESPMLNQSAMSRTGFWFEMECEIPFL